MEQEAREGLRFVWNVWPNSKVEVRASQGPTWHIVLQSRQMIVYFG